MSKTRTYTPKLTLTLSEIKELKKQIYHVTDRICGELGDMERILLDKYNVPLSLGDERIAEEIEKAKAPLEEIEFYRALNKACKDANSLWINILYVEVWLEKYKEVIKK